MITNGEVTINRRRRVGDFEHNDATVKLSFTMEGVSNEEAFRCEIVDEAVKLANRGLSSSSDASVAATSSPVPVPEMTAERRARGKKAEPSAGPVASPQPETAPQPPAAPIVIGAPTAEPASTDPAPPSVVSSPSPDGHQNGSPVAVPPFTPAAIPMNGAAPAVTGPATPVSLSGDTSPVPTVPAPAAVVSPTVATTSPAAGGGASVLADKVEFQKALVAEVTRINGIYPGQGGLRVNHMIAEFVPPPGGASAIPVEKRDEFIERVRSIV